MPRIKSRPRRENISEETIDDEEIERLKNELKIIRWQKQKRIEELRRRKLSPTQRASSSSSDAHSVFGRQNDIVPRQTSRDLANGLHQANQRFLFNIKMLERKYRKREREGRLESLIEVDAYGNFHFPDGMSASQQQMYINRTYQKDLEFGKSLISAPLNELTVMDGNARAVKECEKVNKEFRTWSSSTTNEYSRDGYRRGEYWSDDEYSSFDEMNSEYEKKCRYSSSSFSKMYRRRPKEEPETSDSDSIEDTDEENSSDLSSHQATSDEYSSSESESNSDEEEEEENNDNDITERKIKPEVEDKESKPLTAKTTLTSTRLAKDKNHEQDISVLPVNKENETLSHSGSNCEEKRKIKKATEGEKVIDEVQDNKDKSQLGKSPRFIHKLPKDDNGNETRKSQSTPCINRRTPKGLRSAIATDSKNDEKKSEIASKALTSETTLISTCPEKALPIHKENETLSHSGSNCEEKPKIKKVPEGEKVIDEVEDNKDKRQLRKSPRFINKLPEDGNVIRKSQSTTCINRRTPKGLRSEISTVGQNDEKMNEIAGKPLTSETTLISTCPEKDKNHEQYNSVLPVNKENETLSHSGSNCEEKPKIDALQDNKEKPPLRKSPRFLHRLPEDGNENRKRQSSPCINRTPKCRRSAISTDSKNDEKKSEITNSSNSPTMTKTRKIEKGDSATTSLEQVEVQVTPRNGRSRRIRQENLAQEQSKSASSTSEKGSASKRKLLRSSPNVMSAKKIKVDVSEHENGQSFDLISTEVNYDLEIEQENENTEHSSREISNALNYSIWKERIDPEFFEFFKLTKRTEAMRRFFGVPIKKVTSIDCSYLELWVLTSNFVVTKDGDTFEPDYRRYLSKYKKSISNVKAGYEYVPVERT